MRIPILSLTLTIATCQILPAQCPAVLNCPQGSPVICDITNNDPAFWNETGLTWSPVTESADLYEGAADLHIKILRCAGSTPAVSFELFLDLDNDNLLETVVLSNAPPPPGIVFVNNAFNPGYLGGDPVQFDKRPVPDTAKYTFALEINTFGDTTFAFLRWNSGGQNVLPRISEGKHRIKWRVDQNGVVKFCEYGFRIKDCLEPNLSCKTGATATIDAGGTAIIPFGNALEMVEDNITPYHLLQLSMRKAGDGGGFPLENGSPVGQLTYGCSDLGPHTIELWAKDRSGNVKSCETTLQVTDDEGNCQKPPAICVHPYWADSLQIQNVRFKVLWVDTAQKLKIIPLETQPGGCAELDTLPPAGSFSLIVEKDTNHLNGVSTYDLVLITRHILGLEVFNAPWKWIAADVNRSGSITTFDVLELRKFILGIYNKFPSNTSWRFFDANCNFPDNPFTGYCPSEQTFVTMPVYNYPSPILFRGLKVGDVNGSADPESIAATDPDWRMDPVQLVLPDIVLKAGSQLDIPVNVDQPGYWLGFQFELMYDPQQIVIAYVAPGFLPDFDEEALAFPEPGLLATSWFSGLPQLVLPGKGLFTLRIQALRDVPLRDVLHLSPRRIRPEVYGLHEPARPVELRFASETEQSGETMIFTPRPNPTSAGVAIPLHMSQTEVVRFELADISGKVFFKTEKILEQGGRLIEVPAVAFPYAGVYMWRLHAGGKRLTGKIIRL